MTTHECEDLLARDTIRAVRDESDVREGKILAELGRLGAMLEHLRQFLHAPPLVWRNEMNGHKRSPSFADLVEEITGPGTTPSSPVKAMVYKWTGKQVWRGMWMLVAGLVGILGHWAFEALWTAAHR